MHNELERTGKWSWPNLRYYPGMCLEGLRKTTETSVHLTFQIIILSFINKILKIPPSLSQASITYHPNVFTLILSLSGRVGIGWEPSNNSRYSFYPQK
jgi:hypothetical protein